MRVIKAPRNNAPTDDNILLRSQQSTLTTWLAFWRSRVQVYTRITFANTLRKDGNVRYPRSMYNLVLVGAASIHPAYEPWLPLYTS